MVIVEIIIKTLLVFTMMAHDGSLITFLHFSTRFEPTSGFDLECCIKPSNLPFSHPLTLTADGEIDSASV